MQECPLVLRIISEIGFTLFITWMALDLAFGGSTWNFMLFSILILFVPIWLFAIFGTDMITEVHYDPKEFFNEAEVGIIVMLLGAMTAGFTDPVLSVLIIFCGLLIRFDWLRKHRKKSGAEGEI